MRPFVEKETGKNDERERVAAVFVNRLKINMPSAVRPDHSLWLVPRQGAVGQTDPATRKSSEHAHNTYVIKGLPPTPICNPGSAAIEATLKPAQSKELYFVADGKGGHVFAETLKDHNAMSRSGVRSSSDREQQKAAGSGAAAASAPVQPTTINAKQPAGGATIAPPAPAKKN